MKKRQSTPFHTFTKADHEWLSTTAEGDTGLSLTAIFDRGNDSEQVYAYAASDPHQREPFVLWARANDVSVEHLTDVLDRPMMGGFDTCVGPMSVFPTLRAALAYVSKWQHTPASWACAA